MEAMMKKSQVQGGNDNIQSVGSARAVSVDRLAIIYDRDSGEVRHVHRLTSSEKKYAKDADRDLRAAALQHAELFHGKSDLVQTDVAFAEAHEWKPGKDHWVNSEGKLCCGRR
jgi:hypothetical protein